MYGFAGLWGELSVTGMSYLYNEMLNKLESQYCYSFLLQHPENKIVKTYNTPSIILVCTSKIKENNLEVLDRQSTIKHILSQLKKNF